jgi:type VII secretion protein EccE
MRGVPAHEAQQSKGQHVMIVRLTLAALFVVPAAMAYPWQTAVDRWLLGAAIVVVVTVFAWWRGMFVTTILARRIALLARRGGREGTSASAEYATVALRIVPGASENLPLPLLTGYLDRYGITFDKVRVTSRDLDGARTTWIAVTLGAADNLAALSARSPRLPLQETVALTARRLADHLREIGWDVVLDDAPDALPGEQGKETWRGVAEGRGFVAAYRITVDEHLPETLAAVWSCGADEVWTAVEFIGSSRCPDVTAACAVRTTEKPGATAPVAGLTPERGRHGSALTAMRPQSSRRLANQPAALPHGVLTALRWPTLSAVSRT